MRIVLTYFKQSGKYYSEGSYRTTKRFHGEVVAEVFAMLSRGELPGLRDGARFTVLITALGSDATADTVGFPPHLLTYSEPVQ